MNADSTRLGRRARTAATIVRLGTLYSIASIAKHIFPLPRLARWAWREPPAAPDEPRAQAAIACMVRLRTLTGQSQNDCLQASLVLYRELSAAGCNPQLLGGFRRGGSGIEGHTWVTVNDAVVGETLTTSLPFEPAFAFGRGGARIDVPSGSSAAPI